MGGQHRAANAAARGQSARIREQAHSRTLRRDSHRRPHCACPRLCLVLLVRGRGASPRPPGPSSQRCTCEVVAHELHEALHEDMASVYLRGRARKGVRGAPAEQPRVRRSDAAPRADIEGRSSADRTLQHVLFTAPPPPHLGSVKAFRSSGSAAIFESSSGVTHPSLPPALAAAAAASPCAMLACTSGSLSEDLPPSPSPRTSGMELGAPLPSLVPPQLQLPPKKPFLIPAALSPAVGCASAETGRRLAGRIASVAPPTRISYLCLSGSQRPASAVLPLSSGRAVRPPPSAPELGGAPAAAGMLPMPLAGVAGKGCSAASGTAQGGGA
eukprot:scaffold12647_cov101-Isochrysis_galbana.AAC.3